ncbi:MAG TPA: SRPBCC family protein [Baekduia sp.]|nr:SRPBCC family protein [Baekduia sp.]
MSGLEETIDVDAPARRAYDLWAAFERFGEFVQGVERVQRDGARLHWIAKVGPVTREWDARIVAEEPGRRLAWEAPDGPIDTDITFEALGPARTRVVFRERMHDSLPAQAGAASGYGGRRAREDLERYKALLEQPR